MSNNKAPKSYKAAKRAGNVGTYIILVLISIIWLTPFVLLILQSFRSYTEAGGVMVDYLLPKKFSLDSYIWLFSAESEFPRWIMNTLITAFFTTIFQTLIVLCVAYALSRMRFTGRAFLMRSWLILGMFPGFLTMICLYFLLKELGMTQEGAIPGLILVYCASSGMGYYVMKGYFDTIPKSLDEAARIDGASRLRSFIQILLPLSKPIVIYQALTSFMGPWGDYIFASYIAFGYNKSFNVAVGLQRWITANNYTGYVTRFYAGGIIVAIPISILFFALQRYYVEGVTGGAVKG